MEPCCGNCRYWKCLRSKPVYPSQNPMFKKWGRQGTCNCTDLVLVLPDAMRVYKRAIREFKGTDCPCHTAKEE